MIDSLAVRQKLMSYLHASGLYALILLSLGACTLTSNQTIETQSTSRVVTIDSTSMVAEVEELYGGQVAVWRPDANFAILDFSNAPRVQAEAPKGDVLAGSSRSWSGGLKSWGGGLKSWGGGGDGGEAVTLAQNSISWKQIGLAEAWRQAPNLGDDVAIAVIDTGIDLQHPAFRDNLAPKRTWRDFVDGDNIPQEERRAGNQPGAGYGHGTAVAGIALQVAPNATLVPLRVLGPDGSGFTADVAAAIDWAVRQNVDIVHLSLGTEGTSPVLETMVEFAADRGIYVTSSAGNVFGSNTENDENATVTYPAAYAMSEGDSGEGTTVLREALSIGVGSVNATDQKSSFSRFGEALELVAPGETIYSPVPDGQLAHWDGTSMAAPMVAGVLALALAEAVPQQNVGCLAELIGETAKDVGGGALEDLKGRLEAGAFVARALAPGSSGCNGSEEGD